MGVKKNLLVNPPPLVEGGLGNKGGVSLENLSAAGENLADFEGSNDEIYYGETHLEGAKYQNFHACGALTLPKALKHYK